MAPGSGCRYRIRRRPEESGAILSGAPENQVQALRHYGYNVGMAFQIVDDLLDVQGDTAEVGKPVGNDLLQGVLTLPSIMLMERYPDDQPIDALFAAIRNGGPDPGSSDVDRLLNKSLDMITGSGIIPDCFAIIRDYCAAAASALDDLPDCLPRRSLLEMVDYIANAPAKPAPVPMRGKDRGDGGALVLANRAAGATPLPTPAPAPRLPAGPPVPVCGPPARASRPPLPVCEPPAHPPS